MKQISYVMVKPEFANSTEVIKEVCDRLKKAGLKIKKESYVNYTVEDARAHYAEHIGKGFYQELEDYITSDVAYGMVVEGEDAISTIRGLVQREKGKLLPGDIRHDIPLMLDRPFDMTKNVIHASDKVESAEKEIEIFENICARQVEKE